MKKISVENFEDGLAFHASAVNQEIFSEGGRIFGSLNVRGARLFLISKNLVDSRLVAFVAAVLSFLRHKLTNLRRQPEVEPEPEKDPDEEAMTDEKMRDVWHKAQLGEILVCS